MDLEIEKQEDVTVFWDFSSTQNSSAAATISTSALVKNICSAVSPYGPLKSIRLYWDHTGYPIQPAATRIRSELSASGVCLIDCPAEGRNDGAMKKMLVDLIVHAWDHEAGPHTYVIITTDRDVAYALSRLRMKEYRIILLSPSITHSDLTSQATIQLDWTKSILGLTYLPNANSEDIPATTSRPALAAAVHHPSSSRPRGGTLTSIIYRESADPPLPNPHEPPPGRQSSSPFLPNTTRSYDIGNGLGPGPALPQTPPRASAWSMAGDFHAASLPNPMSSNLNLNSGTAVDFNGMSGGFLSEKPLHFSRRPPDITFDPFNEPDEWTLPSPSRSRKSSKRRESVTLSSESASTSGTRSLVDPQPLSTAPTSAEEEQKPADLKPQSSTSDAFDLRQNSGNIASPRPSASKAIEAAVQSEPRPIQTRLPPPHVNAALPTKTAPSTAAPTAIPSIPVPTPQTSVNASAVPPSVPQIWNPLVNTLRQNGGRSSYTALPPMLLKSYPGAYGLAGRSKYKQYIQLAEESGIVERIELEDPACPSIRLAAAYR